MFPDRNNERMMEHSRIRRLLQTLGGEFTVLQEIRIADIYMREGKYPRLDSESGEFRLFGADEYWGKPDSYFSFKTEIKVPESMDGKELRFALFPNRDGSWNWANPQGLLVVNGKPLQAMDSNRSQVTLSKNCVAGDKYEIFFAAYTDKVYFNAQILFDARIRTVLPEVERFCKDLQVPFDVALNLGLDDYRRQDIIQAVGAALGMLELRKGIGPEFLESLSSARDWFQENFYGRYGSKAEEALVSCIGHSHIDVAWLWDLAQTRDKTLRTFTSALRLMEECPDFLFMSSQPQLYQFIKEDSPETFARIKERVLEGRFEAEGGMWLEADTNLAGGESLIRQFLYGKAFFKSEFGVDNRILWLPDVFGYSAALPQIMKKSGIDYFMTTKISWNEYNQMPFDTFFWQGIDGSSVLAHFIPTMDLDQPGFITTYNGNITASSVMGAWNRYQQKDLNRNVLMSYGWGDGGGGPTIDMVETGRRLKKGVPGCPRVEFETARTFFERLEEDLKGKSVPRWVGELYFEFHRGTYTTMGKNKLLNRKTENLLHEAEWALTLANAMSLSLEYPKEALDKAWKIVLLNQFHDILPGSSIKEVYDQSWIQYEEAQTILHKELEKAMGAINGCILPPEGGVSALNSSPFPVSETMLADFNPGSDLVDLHGNPVLVQETADGRWALAARDIPAGSAVVFRHGSGEPANAETVPELKVTEKSLENRFISVMFNANMEISSLIEKSSGVDLADPQKSLCRLVAYDDRPHGDEAWNIQAYYKDISWRTELVSSSVLESGPCRAIIRVSRMYGDSSIIQDFILGVDAKRLDVRFWVDWKQRRCLLKAEFPVPVNASKATFDIQFGNIERSTHNNTLWDFAQFEVCGHKWADMGDSGMGLSLLSESKHGFGAKDGVLSLSLLRGTTHPNESADLGIHEFSLSLYPHSGEWRQAETISQGYAFNCPLRAWTGAGEGKALASSLAASDHANVIIETAKRAEDGNGWIFRIFESHNKKTDFSITFLRALKFARLESLMESGGEELDVNGHALRLSIKPYEILTVRANWI